MPKELKINEAQIGFNKFCGPAVLSILTGKNTDTCANVIGSITGQYQVRGVHIHHMVKALDKMNFDAAEYSISGSLFRVLTHLSSKEDNIYFMQIADHFIIIEVSNHKIFFCDNHTKEPMPAASSARMMQPVYHVYIVKERPKPALLPLEYTVITEYYIKCKHCYSYRMTKTKPTPEEELALAGSINHDAGCAYKLSVELHK